MTFSITINLDTKDEETLLELFTRPLRGVLGGRDLTFFNNQVDGNDQDKAILEVWQRVIVGIALFTVGIPYAFFAAVALVASATYATVDAPIATPNERALALLANTSKSNSLTVQDKIAFSAIWDQSISKLEPIEVNQVISEDEFNLIETEIINNLQQPTIFRISANHTNTICMLIPVLKETRGLMDERLAIFVSKHPSDIGEDAGWYCNLEIDSDQIIKVMLPLWKEPDQSKLDYLQIAVLKGVIDNKTTFTDKHITLLRVQGNAS